MRRPSQRKRQEPLVNEIFFVGGTVLVVVGLVYAVAKSWPSIDPLILAALVGIGLLLVVACERLNLIFRELRKITALMQIAVGDAERNQETETGASGRG